MMSLAPGCRTSSNGSAIDVDADFAQHRRQRPRVGTAPPSIAEDRRDVIERGRTPASPGKCGPFGRLHPRDAPALLIDQDRRSSRPCSARSSSVSARS
jgi:hypothetical protein